MPLLKATLVGLLPSVTVTIEQIQNPSVQYPQIRKRNSYCHTGDWLAVIIT